MYVLFLLNVHIRDAADNIVFEYASKRLNG